MKPPSHAMNKPTARTFIQVWQKPHLKKDIVTIKDLAAYKNDTELSKEFWKIKRRNFVSKIKWRILRKCLRFNRLPLRCNPCLDEKLEIALFKGNNILNRRTELNLKWRHVNKHTLLRHDTKD